MTRTRLGATGVSAVSYYDRCADSHIHSVDVPEHPPLQLSRHNITSVVLSLHTQKMSKLTSFCENDHCLVRLANRLAVEVCTESCQRYVPCTMELVRELTSLASRSDLWISSCTACRQESCWRDDSVVVEREVGS